MHARIPLVCCIVALLACAAMHPRVAAAQVDVDASPSSMRALRPERQPGFPCVVALLERIVEDAQTRGPQHLYIGALVDPSEQSGAGTVARVYWLEDNAILLIDWPASCGEEDMRIDDAALGWYRTKARIDLDTDVVPTPEDIRGSTYLVDRDWVDRIIAACRRGHLLVVEPRVRD